EFARMAVKSFGLSSPEGGQGGKVYADTAGHWAREDVAALAAAGALAPYQDGTFKPDRPITRSEIVAALDRLLGFGAKEQVFGGEWPASYPDVPESDPNFRLVELGRRLGYMPPSYAPSFLPGALVTRAEAAWMIDRIQRMKRIRGTVVSVEPELGLLTVSPDGGTETLTVELDPRPWCSGTTRRSRRRRSWRAIESWPS
ncbi:MAG: S-layer homology domain-containing protein, partial [Firmicutes bacterium]|nr:S-layer homology domain-containing protein [Bacillota bacterium]